MTSQLESTSEDWRLPHNFTEALVVELFRRSGWKLSCKPVSSPWRRERTVEDIVDRVHEFYPRFPVGAVRPAIRGVVQSFPVYTTTDVFAAFARVASRQPDLLFIARHQYEQALAQEAADVLKYDPPFMSHSTMKRVGLTAVVVSLFALASYCSFPLVKEFNSPSSQALAYTTNNHNSYKPLETSLLYGTDSTRR